MDKLFYLTESGVELIEQDKVKSSVRTKLLWTELKKIEKLIKELDSLDKLSVILNFVDESIHTEWTSKRMPWEKKDYIQRKESKIYAENSLFVNIFWLNEFRKDSNGREEQLIIVASIDENPALKNFFEALEEAQVSLISIYSYPFLLEQFFLKKIVPGLGLNKQKLKAPFMLVFRESKYNFKQMFFQKGYLKISRNVELDPELETEEAIVLSVVSETKIAIKYLYNQKIIPFNSEVGLVYLTIDGQENFEILSEFKETIVSPDWERNKVVMEAADLYRLTKTKQIEGEDRTLIDFLSDFLQRKKVTSFYKNTLVKKIQLLRSIKQLLIASLLLVLIVGSVLVLNNLITSYLVSQKIDSLALKVSSFNSEKKALQETIDLKYDAVDIKASVEFSESLLSVRINNVLGFSVENLSEVLSRHPNVLISGVNWFNKEQFDANNLEVILEGWVFPFKGAFENPVKWVDALVEDLRNSPNISKVELIKAPLERRLEKALVVSSLEKEEVNALPFTLKLTIGDADAQAK